MNVYSWFSENPLYFLYFHMSSSPASYCDACGSAQASHVGLWIDNVMDAVSLRVPLYRLPLYRVLMGFAGAIIDVLGQLSFTVGRAVRVITLSKEPNTAVSNRSKLLWQGALARGIQMEQIMMLGA